MTYVVKLCIRKIGICLDWGNTGIFDDTIPAFETPQTRSPKLRRDSNWVPPRPKQRYEYFSELRAARVVLMKHLMVSYDDC
jgi:hypothetical protein